MGPFSFLICFDKITMLEGYGHSLAGPARDKGNNTDLGWLCSCRWGPWRVPCGWSPRTLLNQDSCVAPLPPRTSPPQGSWTVAGGRGHRPQTDSVNPFNLSFRSQQTHFPMSSIRPTYRTGKNEIHIYRNRQGSRHQFLSQALQIKG